MPPRAVPASTDSRRWRLGCTLLSRPPCIRSSRPIEAKTLAALTAKLVDAKKAEDIQVIDVSERLRVADYFVVATGANRAHVRALYDELHVRLKELGERHKPVEGADLGWWIVLDYADVVVHLFQNDAREFYDLDHLYGDCPRLEWSSVETPDLPPLPTAEV